MVLCEFFQQSFKAAPIVNIIHLFMTIKQITSLCLLFICFKNHSIKSTSHLAGLLLRTNGSAIKFGHETCSICIHFEITGNTALGSSRAMFQCSGFMAPQTEAGLTCDPSYLNSYTLSHMWSVMPAWCCQLVPIVLFVICPRFMCLYHGWMSCVVTLFRYLSFLNVFIVHFSNLAVLKISSRYRVFFLIFLNGRDSLSHSQIFCSGVGGEQNRGGKTVNIMFLILLPVCQVLKKATVLP